MMTENRTAKEIHAITEAIYPLCGWGEYVNSDKELYMQDLWDYWVDKLKMSKLDIALIKKIEELTEDELRERMDALYPLCGHRFINSINSDKEFFMQDQWEALADMLYEVRMKNSIESLLKNKYKTDGSR